MHTRTLSPQTLLVGSTVYVCPVLTINLNGRRLTITCVLETLAGDSPYVMIVELAKRRIERREHAFC